MIEKRIDKIEAAELFPPLQSKMNKGDAGRVLVICGSYDPKGLSMCGAAYFAAKAAYRCGAGIVEIFTPRENYAALAELVPEAVFSLYGYDESPESVSKRLASEIAKSDAVILGCGLGKSDMALSLTRTALSCVKCPLVIDADGLNILAESSDLWSLLGSEQRKRTVVTPHPGEMSRLTGKGIPEIVAAISETAVDFAKEKQIVCLLKDHNTAVSDGETVYINQSGNPGMASAGMGDVLAGIIGALLARLSRKPEIVTPEKFLLSVAVATFVHGRAGDLAAEKTGQYSLNSSDLLAEIPSVIADFLDKNNKNQKK